MSSHFPSNLPDPTRTFAKISRSHDKGTLYRKKITEGNLKSLKGLHLIGAYLGHAFKWLFSDLKQENDQLMEEMFSSCKIYFEESEQKITEQPPNIHTRAEPTKKSPSSFDIKMAEKVLGKFSQTEDHKAYAEKMTATLETQKATIKAKTAPEVQRLIDDPLWKEITSLQEVLDLGNKLAKTYPRSLSTQEQELLRRCLLLNEKCAHARNAMIKDPSQKEWISEKELNAIQNISDQFAKKALKAHEKLEKNYGKVEGSPSGKQVFKALKLAKKELSPYRGVCNTPELEKIYIRAFHLVLLGSEKAPNFPDSPGNYLKILEEGGAFKSKEKHQKEAQHIAQNYRNESETIQHHTELASLYAMQAPLISQALEPILLNEAGSLHQQLGSVTIEEGILVASTTQLKEAVALMTQKFPFLEPKSDPKMKELRGKIVQHILCGKEGVSQINSPSDIFLIKELKDKELQSAIPMNLLPGESFLSHHINTQEKTITHALNLFFYNKGLLPQKHGRPESAFLEHSDLKKLTQEKDWEIFRAVLQGRAEKIANPEQRDAILVWINNALPSDLRELQKEIRHKSIKTYLGNFIKDVIDRGERISLNGVTYQLNEKRGVEEFFTTYRTLYFQRLLENPELIQIALHSNQHHEETAGIPHNLDENTFHSWLRESPLQQGIPTITRLTSFTPEQLQQLSNASGLPKEDIEPLLRIKALQMMVTTNQSVQLIHSQELDPSLTPLRLKLGLNDIHLQAHDRFLIISSDLEGISTSTPNVLNLTIDQAYEKGIAIPEDYNKDSFPIGALREQLYIPSVTAWKDESHEAGKLSEYQNFKMNLDFIDHLDTLVTAIFSSP